MEQLDELEADDDGEKLLSNLPCCGFSSPAGLFRRSISLGFDEVLPSLSTGSSMSHVRSLIRSSRDVESFAVIFFLMKAISNEYHRKNECQHRALS